jgi:hypothetical protein
MSQALVDSLRERRAKLAAEAEGIRPVVERAQAEYEEAKGALERAIQRVDACDAEIRAASSA